MAGFYYLFLLSSATQFLTFTINGFPLLNSEASDSVAIPFLLNDYLVAGRNEICLHSTPTMRAGGAPAALQLKVFQEGQVVTPEDGVVIPLGHGSIAPPPIGENPACLSFAQREFDFAQLLTVSPPSDHQGLADYAAMLIDMFDHKDVAGLLREMGPKVTDYAQAIGRTRAEVESEFVEMAQRATAAGLERKPERAEIAHRPWCGGRVHELYLKPDRPLFATAATEDGTVEVQVFVARIGKEWKVVR